MYDFNDIRSASKAEQIRAWAVEKAIDIGLPSDGRFTAEVVVNRAAEIEKFVLEGRKEID